MNCNLVSLGGAKLLQPADFVVPGLPDAAIFVRFGAWAARRAMARSSSRRSMARRPPRNEPVPGPRARAGAARLEISEWPGLHALSSGPKPLAKNLRQPANVRIRRSPLACSARRGAAAECRPRARNARGGRWPPHLTDSFGRGGGARMEIEDRRLQSQGTKASVNDGLSLFLTFALRPSTHRKRGSGTRTASGENSMRRRRPGVGFVAATLRVQNNLH